MTDYTYGPWTVHTPGECPVPPDTLVQVQLRNQSQFVAEQCASWPENDWDWSEDGEEAIAYYRIARQGGVAGGDGLAAQAARDERMRAEGAKAAEARIERLVENLISAAASLAAAISLLERSGMAVKKAAPSNRMFDQMLIDYRATLESARAALQENGD